MPRSNQIQGAGSRPTEHRTVVTIASDERATRDQWRSPAAQFPLSTPRQLNWGAAARSAALIAVGATVFVLRQPSSSDNLYSEDGVIFIPQALAGSSWDAITTSYAGYLHVAPRLISELVAALPLTIAPIALAVMSGVVVASIGLLVYLASAASIPSRAFRVVIGSAVVLMPLAHEEYLANIANIHWALLFGAFVVIFWRPTTRREAGVGSLVVALAALSDPLALFLVPVAVVRLFALNGWRQHVISWTLILCSGLQAQTSGSRP